MHAKPWTAKNKAQRSAHPSMSDPTSIDPCLQEILTALDPAAIGAIYCDEGGVDWFEHTAPLVRSHGARWAEALSSRLSPGGASLYVGAGLAELPAMLHERRALQRRVRACTLRGAEADLLNQALSRAGVGAEELCFTHEDGLAAAQHPESFDHLALVSVLDDPEEYPQLSAVTYGRIHPEALDLERFAEERERVRGLVAGLLPRLELPGILTTTVEEVAWVLAEASRLQLRARADDELVETAVVGDAVGFLRLEKET